MVLFYLDRYSKGINISERVPNTPRESHPQHLCIPNRGYQFNNVDAAKRDMKRLYEKAEV